MKKLTLFFIISFLLISLNIKSYSAERLKVVTLNYPPTAFVDANGNAIGIHVDIAKEAFKRIGIDFEINFYPWKRALVMVYKGEADALIDPAYNDERSTHCYFPKESSNMDQWVFFQKKGNKIVMDKDLKEVNHISIGIVRGFEYGGHLQTALNEKRFNSIQVVNNNDININKLIAGRFDVMAGDKANILYYSKQLGLKDKIEIVKSKYGSEELIISESPTYIAFSKKTIAKELVDKFSDTVLGMKKDGTFEKIRSKYLN